MEIAQQSIKVGQYEWFYRSCGPENSGRLPVVLLHGLIAPSYSWREVMPLLADLEFRCIAPDWLGCARSARFFLQARSDGASAG